MRAATRESAKLDLSHIDQSHHEEATATNRANARYKHAKAEGSFIDMGEELDVVVEGGGGGEAEGLLEGQGDEAGEEEGAEGEDVEGHQVFCDGGGGGAGGVGDEAVVGVVGVPRQAYEDG